MSVPKVMSWLTGNNSAEAYAPYCATLYSVIEGNTYGHYGCANRKTSYEVLFTPGRGEAESTAELESETDIASFTGFSLSRVTTASTSEDSDVSTTDATSRSAETTSDSSGGGGATTTNGAQTPVQSGVASTTASSGRAERTAGVALGLVGGCVGAVGLFV